MRFALLAPIIVMLLLVTSGGASASVSIALSSPPLDDLEVAPGQDFSIYIRVYNNGDEPFTAHLEATENLPVEFGANDFELSPGTNRQVKVGFSIPGDWEPGSVREGEISVTAVTSPSEPGEGTAQVLASAQVLGSLSKRVVLRVGEETNIPEGENQLAPPQETPSELSTLDDPLRVEDTFEVMDTLEVITSGIASAQPRNIPREDLEQQMEPAMEPTGVDWMGIWVSYWWLIVIGLGAAIGSGLEFVFTRGLI